MQTAIIVVILIIMLKVIMIVWLDKAKKAKDNKNFKVFKSFADNNNCQIEITDRWGTRNIGLDVSGQKLLFMNQHRDKNEQIVVDLSDLTKCKPVHLGRVVGGGTQVYDRLELVLSFKGNGKQDQVINFYDSTYDPLSLRDEMKLLEKWNVEIGKMVPVKA